MGEIGRTGWFVFGAVMMALAGLAHAVASVAHIGRDMMRAPRPAGPGSVPAARQQARPLESEPGGWILFGALIMAAGGIYHAITGAREIIREILHPAPAR